MAKVHATRVQIVQIAELLKEHLKPAEGGLFAYDGDWSDAKIAAEVATEANRVKAGHVLNIRAEVFGNLRTSTPTPAGDVRVAALEASLAAERSRGDRLDTRLAELADLHAKLCIKLSLERVADVRHLTGRAPSAANAAISSAANSASLNGNRLPTQATGRML